MRGGLPIAKPPVLLALQLAGFLAVVGAAGGLRMVWTPDSLSYVRASRAEELAAALAHYRTVGYPLFLETAGRLGAAQRPVPWIQALVFVAAVLAFWHGLRVYAGSGWFAFAAAAALPFAGVMALVAMIQPDFLAACATLLAFAALLLLAAGRSQPLAWVGLALAVFAAYQLRPAAAFLVGFVPLIGAALRHWRGGGGRRAGVFTLGLAAAMLVPYLSFCALRWATVGHFGLVSFGGTNLVALAANFLDEELLGELPEGHRRLAGRLLHQRQKRGWEPMTPGADTMPYLVQYNSNLWRIAVPAAGHEIAARSREAVAAGEEPDPRNLRIVRDELLGGVAVEILARRPRLYLQWVRDAHLYGLAQLGDDAALKALAVLVLGSLPVLVVARRRHRRGPSGRSAAGRPLLALGALGTGYFVTYLALVSLVSYPFARYFVSTTLLLPSVLAAALFEIWRRILVAGNAAGRRLRPTSAERPSPAGATRAPGRGS